MDMELDKVYVNTSKGLAEYKGGINFPNGTKKCQTCESNMERMPLGQSFVRVSGGKILVDNINGVLIVSNTETINTWYCNKCGTGV